MNFSPPNTPEQAEILDFALTRKESLLVEALAGTAKTTTVERVAISLSSTPILYLVFNKRNQEEAARRMPGHVKCLTANALGHGVWSRFTGRRLIVNKKKNYEILYGLINELGQVEAQEAYKGFSEILQAIREAKTVGYLPRNSFTDINPLSADDPFEARPTPLQLLLLDQALKLSIKAAFNGIIDFDDQIYMPVLFGGTWPQFPLVVVDEAQDLTPLQHTMLQRLVSNRIIAVGDYWQSIYAFRGAVRSGMADLQKTYSMDSRPLSISFRCPRSVIRRAWWRVPHFKWPDWAEEGEVNDLDEFTAGSIDDNAAIICRNNAPLLSCALRLIRLGRGVKLVGSDIGPGLIRILQRLGPETMKQTEVLNAIDRYEAAALAKARSPASTADKCDCLRVFAGAGPNLSAAIGYAQHIFSAGGPIQLLSGHKAKGLEWNTVYHLDPQRIPSAYAESDEELEQEYNVRYVIETRAKRVLNIVRLENLT